jgi:hypothetical protein
MHHDEPDLVVHSNAAIRLTTWKPFPARTLLAGLRLQLAVRERKRCVIAARCALRSVRLELLECDRALVANTVDRENVPRVPLVNIAERGKPTAGAAVAIERHTHVIEARLRARGRASDVKPIHTSDQCAVDRRAATQQHKRQHDAVH